MKQLQKPREKRSTHFTVLPLRSPTKRSTGEKTWTLSQDVPPKMLYRHILTVSFLSLFQKLKQWKALTLWLDSCSSSSSKAAGRCPTKTQTETPCAFLTIFHGWNLLKQTNRFQHNWMAQIFQFCILSSLIYFLQSKGRQAKNSWQLLDIRGKGSSLYSLYLWNWKVWIRKPVGKSNFNLCSKDVMWEGMLLCLMYVFPCSLIFIQRHLNTSVCNSLSYNVVSPVAY